MPPLFVLFEHAAGYGLFRVKEFEEIGMLLPQVESSVPDLKKFNQVVDIKAFIPFKTAAVALENINNISEGLMTEDLQLFLEKNFPKDGKATLGVGDQKLAATISDTLGYNCKWTGAIPEIIRGIRLHFSKLVKGLSSNSSTVAQLGLGHSYSRAKVKFNVNRVDNMIIQSIALLDQLEKDINTFSMRIREWYSYHFPELYKIIPENYLYSKCASFIKNRKELTEEKLDELEQIVMDRGKAEAIFEASKSSMGMEIALVDLINIEMFAKRVISLTEYKTELAIYLHSKMEAVAPSLAALIGDLVGARLISHAGSLTSLAKFPASTVQILGAEKALFRALKKKSTNTPKYGLLFNSSYIAKADSSNKGRISRFLANKCSLASRIDCFSESPSSIFGEKLRQQVDDRLKYYVTGELPPKNVDVMKEAVAELQANIKKVNKKKKKKDKKRKLENGESSVDGHEITINLDETIEENGEPPLKKKKNKKKKSKDISFVEE
uniref:Nucleolar protein 56 n=1 Tax=Triatoma dimidiata TaxID=72491 RepID=A0A0V0G5W8_TRIDM